MEALSSRGCDLDPNTKRYIIFLNTSCQVLLDYMYFDFVNNMFGIALAKLQPDTQVGEIPMLNFSGNIDVLASSLVWASPSRFYRNNLFEISHKGTGNVLIHVNKDSSLQDIIARRNLAINNEWYSIILLTKDYTLKLAGKADAKRIRVKYQ